MGDCVSVSDGQRGPARENKLPVLLQKARIILEQQIMKRSKTLQEQQFSLYQNFLKDKVNRSLTVQKAIIGRTVYYKNINQIYLICSTQCKAILDRKGAIQSNIQVVQASMQTLVYSASILKEDVLYELQQYMRSYGQFKFPNDNDIRHELVKIHKKTDQVTFQMENSFILEFCGVHNIEMTKINEVGHNYGYSAGRHTILQ